jgi:hypothetical protein
MAVVLAAAFRRRGGVPLLAGGRAAAMQLRRSPVTMDVHRIPPKKQACNRNRLHATQRRF